MDFVYIGEIHTHLPGFGWGTGRDRSWVRYPARNEISKDAGPCRRAGLLALRGPWRCGAPGAARPPALRGLGVARGDGRCGEFYSGWAGVPKKTAAREVTAPIVRSTPPGAGSQKARP